MPININHADNGTFVEFIASGSVSIGDVAEAIRQVYAGSKFAALKYQLVDYSAVEDYESDMNGSRQIVELDKQAAKSNPNMRVAIVAPTDIIFGSARYWELNMGSTPIQPHVFRDRDSAIAWLFQ
jgi:hypothetical protein